MTTYSIQVRCPVCGQLHLVSRESYVSQPPVNDLVWCDEAEDYIEQPDPGAWVVTPWPDLPSNP